jgi:hypothetical protein
LCTVTSKSLFMSSRKALGITGQQSPHFVNIFLHGPISIRFQQNPKKKDKKLTHVTEVHMRHPLCYVMCIWIAREVIQRGNWDEGQHCIYDVFFSQWSTYCQSFCQFITQWHFRTFPLYTAKPKPKFLQERTDLKLNMGKL